MLELLHLLSFNRKFCKDEIEQQGVKLQELQDQVCNEHW